MELHHEKNAAWLLSSVQNGGNDVQILGILEMKYFTKKTCTIEAIKLW